MPETDRVITIVTHFKNWEDNSKWNVGTLVDLTLRNHDNAVWAIIYLCLQNFHLPQQKQRPMPYNDFKMGYNTCFDHDDFQILLSFLTFYFQSFGKLVISSISRFVNRFKMKQSYETISWTFLRVTIWYN